MEVRTPALRPNPIQMLKRVMMSESAVGWIYNRKRVGFILVSKLWMVTPSNKECSLCGGKCGIFFLGLIQNSDKNWVKMVWIKIANVRQFGIRHL